MDHLNLRPDFSSRAAARTALAVAVVHY